MVFHAALPCPLACIQTAKHVSTFSHCIRRAHPFALHPPDKQLWAAGLAGRLGHEFLSRSEEAVFATSEIPSLADKFTTTHTLRYAEYNVLFLLALACFCESTSSSSSISISTWITLGIRPFRKTVEPSAFHGLVFFECFESHIRTEQGVSLGFQAD